MPEKIQPVPKPVVPDPSDTYERAHPENESGQGRMDNDIKATPTPRPDKMPKTVPNAQDGNKQVNSQGAATRPDNPPIPPIDAEPLGWGPGKKK